MVSTRSAANRLREKPIEHYDHAGKQRLNNPPVGLVTPSTDADSPTKTYAYDPHLDPQLVWAGKAERASFDVPTVSLHVHERIDPRTIVEAVRRDGSLGAPELTQPSLFAQLAENPPLREAIDFYRHAHGWSNRLIAGDSLLVMNSLLEKEGLAGQVQMIYLDPPYGVKYGSNFQPFVNRRDVKDGKDEDLTQEPEMVRAFRDTWELGIHSYLSYLRDRLLLARELLHETGSIFVQISDENLHHVRELMDEVFGSENFVSLITFNKTTGATSKYLPGAADYLLWCARSLDKVTYRPLYATKEVGSQGATNYNRVLLPDGTRRYLSAVEKADLASLPRGSRVYSLDNLTSQSVGRQKGEGAASWFPVLLDGKEYRPSYQVRWKTNQEGMENLRRKGRLESTENRLGYVRFFADFPVYALNNSWTDVGASFMADKLYVVQTNTKVIQRCLLMTTDPGDLVLDPTCGSGTTAFVAEQWGRRWVTCDTSRVAVTLARQRLMTALYDYYELARPDEGVGSGFTYKTVPHVTLKSIANDEPPAQETLYDQPLIDRGKARVSGPFTVEAVPAPAVKPLAEVDAPPPAGDASVARSGPTLRQAEWRDELLKAGIRGKGGQLIAFSRVEPLGGTRYLHADAETREERPRRVVVSFGPDFAPLEQRQVELAWEEALTLAPRPALLVFAAFQFDPEAAKDIDEMDPARAGITFLKAQMNTDLLTEDLKKKRSSNQSFWLIGQPDIELRRLDSGDQAGQYQVEVLGFDYYDTRSGAIESGDAARIAVWLLDTDYDGRSLYPRQVFFPLAGESSGWSRLARNLKAEIDEERIEAYRGAVSLPFTPGPHRRVAVKVVDDRGIESLKVLAVG